MLAFAAVATVSQVEEKLLAAVESLPGWQRTYLLEVLRMTSEKRAEEIGRLHAWNRAPVLTELLIDLEEDAGARAVMLGVLAGSVERPRR